MEITRKYIVSHFWPKCWQQVNRGKNPRTMSRHGRVGIPKSVILGADAFVMSPSQLFSILIRFFPPGLATSSSTGSLGPQPFPHLARRHPPLQQGKSYIGTQDFS